MTSTAIKKSSATLRKELDRRTTSRATLESEIIQAREKLSAALDTGDTAAGVRLQTRLSALEGLREQEDRLVNRLTEELAELDAKDAEEKGLDALVALANKAVREQRAFEQLQQEINSFLNETMPKVLDHIAGVQRARIDFIAKFGDLGVSMGMEAVPIAWLRRLEERGAKDLSVVLAHWVGTPYTVTERHYQGPVLEPYGSSMSQLTGIAEHQRAQSARVADERERYGEAPAA